jgi:hypothetical protein
MWAGGRPALSSFVQPFNLKNILWSRRRLSGLIRPENKKTHKDSNSQRDVGYTKAKPEAGNLKPEKAGQWAAGEDGSYVGNYKTLNERTKN